jgi:hypothetical protein
MLKRRGSAAYLFAVNMRNHPTRGSFFIRQSTLGLGPSVKATVLDEARGLPLRDAGRIDESGPIELTDDFKPYEVHLYELRRATE